ncbi:MAG: hypothetical protein LUG93_19415 [Lachnospiraceae bacterium]|nr:hypothetical protein [Lachnospiraceae bacterium]
MNNLTEKESLLLSIFRSLDTAGQFSVITLCMNENDRCTALQHSRKAHSSNPDHSAGKVISFPVAERSCTV